MTQTKSTTSGLSDVIEAKLKAYFDNLKGGRPSCGLYNEILKEVERPLLKLVLESVQGNKVKAAEILGINRNTLSKKLKELKA